MGGCPRRSSLLLGRRRLLCLFNNVCHYKSQKKKKVSRYFFLTLLSFHLLWNHSHDVSRFCNKLDYLGILILMWGAGIPTIYYGFICNHSLRIVYWTMVQKLLLSRYCRVVWSLTIANRQPARRSAAPSLRSLLPLSHPSSEKCVPASMQALVSVPSSLSSMGSSSTDGNCKKRACRWSGWDGWLRPTSSEQPSTPHEYVSSKQQ